STPAGALHGDDAAALARRPPFRRGRRRAVAPGHRGTRSQRCSPTSECPGREMIAMNLDMTAAHQERVARIAVGASTARNQGGPGVVAAARQFFAGLDLRRFARRNARRYRAELDMATDELLGRLPPVAASWGLARKLLNIFIRDASYHVVLNAEYGLLDRAGRHMELPLDSLTAAGLKRALERGALPA